MDQVQKDNEAVPGNLSKLLAVTVRSVQWSYAIFWSISQPQQGVLEWGDGYYNGDIKTKKTCQAMEVVKAAKMGLQRSKQLRELYESLSSQGDNASEDEPATLPSGTTMSLEDLSDAEWFYMVCMSFVFPPGQGLPGRALASDQSIWLCNAQYSSRKVFVRSLLAKSASVQTVLCFPYLGGVMELGSTELVPEDPVLVLRVKTILLDFSKPNCYYSSPSYSTDNNQNDSGKIQTSRKANNAAEDTIEGDQEMSLDGPSEDSEDDLAVGLHQQYHQFTDVLDSLSSSNCVSNEIERSTDKITKPKSGAANITPVPNAYGNSADLHYSRAISAIIEKSNLLTRSSGCRSCVRKSSFGIWKNLGNVTKSKPLEQQKILKRMLFTIPLMYRQCVIKQEVKYIENKVIGETLNSRFITLRSMIPSAGTDKASVLEDTIKYVQELEARLGELESNIEKMALPEKEASKVVVINDLVEQTSAERKTFQLKRKACEESELNNSLKVQILEQEVLIEMSCTWREYLLLDIMDALNRLQLDAHSVQSRTRDDGAFTLKVISKFRGTEVIYARALKQAIWESVCL